MAECKICPLAYEATFVVHVCAIREKKPAETSEEVKDRLDEDVVENVEGQTWQHTEKEERSRDNEDGHNFDDAYKCD
jgi:hypothetical protein